MFSKIGLTMVAVTATGLLLSSRVWAESYNANQLVELALKNSSLTKAYELDAKSKAKLSEQAGAWDNPSFEIGTENKKESGGDTKLVRYGLSQTFYMPGKFSARERISKGEVEIAKFDLATTELKLRSLILNLIYEFKASKEKLSHAEERLERFKTVEGFIKSRVFVAPQKKAEASIVTGKLIVLQKELFHIQARTENIWNELNSYLKLPSKPEIQISWFKNGPALSLQELSSQVIANNSNLKRQDSRVAQSKNESDLAALDSWPGLTLSGTYSDGSGYNPEKIYGLGISLPIPIFNANRSARAASELKHQAENERLSFLKEQTTKDLRAALLNFELAKKSVLGLPVKKIEDLEKAIFETDKGFKRGQVDLITYLEADSQHFESLSAILEAQLDLIRSISELQTLTGNNQLILEK